MSLFEVALIFGKILKYMFCYNDLQWTMPIEVKVFKKNALLLNMKLCGIFWYVVPS